MLFSPDRVMPCLLLFNTKKATTFTPLKMALTICLRTKSGVNVAGQSRQLTNTLRKYNYPNIC